MPAPGQPAEDLLIWTADVMPVVHGTFLASQPGGAVGGRVKGILRPIHRLQRVADAGAVHPSFAIVMEVRINALEVKVGAGLQHVIQFGGEAIAGTVILVSAKVGACEVGMIDPALVCNNPRPRLEVINPAPIPIVSSTQQEAELLVLSKALAIGSIVCSEPAATDNVRVSSLPSELKQRPLSGGLGHEVHRAPNRVAILIRRQRLVHLNAIDKAGGNDVQLDIPDVTLGGRQIHSVDGYVAQPRLRSANLHVFSL